MSNNYWDQQQQNGQNNGNNGNNGNNYTGNLVNGQRQQPPPMPLQMPPSRPNNPISPLPPSPFPPQQSWPSAQSWPSPMSPSPMSPSPMSPAPMSPMSPSPMSPMSPAQPPAFPNDPENPPQNGMWRVMDMARRISGKFFAVPPSVDQQPLVLYRPIVPPPPTTNRPRRWKRSRSVRIAIQMRHRRERWQRSQPKIKNYLIGAFIALCLLLVVALSSGGGYVYAYYQSQLPQLQGIASHQLEQTSRIYDRNGQLLYEAYDNKGRSTPIAYTYIPQIMQEAMIAAEDHTFWSNVGIDPQGIVRAGTEYLQSNAVQGGGSTITQQVIKNITGNNQVSLQRKIPEAALAIGLTQQYPKWKILEMYFDVAGFGALDIGVESAAEDFFHVKPKCDKNFNCIPGIAFLGINPRTHKPDPILALARASLLAGMPQNPPSYDPTVSVDTRSAALARQAEVLGQMLGLGQRIDLGLGDQSQDMGPITQDMVNKAEALTARMSFTRYVRPFNDPHFVLWVVSQLETVLGNGDAQLGTHLFLSGGFNIRTTIDSKLEAFIEADVRHHLRDQEYQYFLPDEGPLNTLHNVNDSAVVVMNAKTGEVLAMDGSAQWNDNEKTVQGQFNAAISPRQPGSSFKPIVYATAFQMGWYPGIVLPDVKTTFPLGPGTTYQPSDYGGTATRANYSGMNTNVRLAISNSFNVPAVKTIEFAGINNVLTMAQRLGITTMSKALSGPSTALGTEEVPLLQMVGAYEAFANQGMRVPPQGILDIWDNYGHHLYHYDPHGVQVLSQQIAFLITSIISDERSRAYEFENDHVLSMWDWPRADGTFRDVAAKTGTTQDFRDNWTLGYTSDVVVGVWSGNADNSPFTGNVVGITGAAPIWHDVIEYVSGRCLYNSCSDMTFPTNAFTPPPGVVQMSVSTSTGLEGTGNTDWMLPADAPQQAAGPLSNASGH